MKLEKWALIAEIVGGLAIVVTLVVLIVEVRGNTDAIAAQTIYAQYSQERERRNRSIANVGGIVDIRLKARIGDPLTDAENLQYGIYAADLLDNFRWQYREVQAGRLPGEFIDLGVWVTIWEENHPGLPVEYEHRRATLDPAFVRFFDENVVNR